MSDHISGTGENAGHVRNIVRALSPTHVPSLVQCQWARSAEVVSTGTRPYPTNSLYSHPHGFRWRCSNIAGEAAVVAVSFIDLNNFRSSEIAALRSRADEDLFDIAQRMPLASQRWPQDMVH